MTQRLDIEETREFLAKVEEDLKKEPVGPVPTPRVDKAIEKIMKKARSKMKKIKHCDCKDWEKNMKLLDRMFVFCDVHGVKWKGKVFDYCPWCGSLLFEEDKKEGK